MVAVTEQRDSESFFDGGRIRAGWKTALGSLTCLIVGPSVVASICFGVFAPHLREAFGWSVPEVALAVTAMSFSVMLASLLSGPIIDHFGVRRVVLTCIPLFGLGFAAMGLQTGELWQFYLAWLLIPLIGIGLWPGSWAKATAGWFRARLGIAVAIATLGVGVGAAFMPIVINGLADAQGWRSAYFVIGIGSILLAFPAAYFWVHEAPAGHAATVDPAAPAQRIGTLLRDSRLVCLGVAFLALGLFSAVILTNLVLILQDNGMRREQAVIGQSIIGLSTIAGRLLCGWLLDRLPFRLVVPAFCIATAAAIAGLAGGATGPQAFVCAAVIGMMIGAEIDLLGYAIQRLFGRARYATLFGGIFAMFHIGGASGGAMISATHKATGSFALGLGIASAACLFAALLFALIAFGRREEPVRASVDPGGAMPQPTP